MENIYNFSKIKRFWLCRFCGFPRNGKLSSGSLSSRRIILLFGIILLWILLWWIFILIGTSDPICKHGCRRNPYPSQSHMDFGPLRTGSFTEKKGFLKMYFFITEKKNYICISMNYIFLLSSYKKHSSGSRQ